MKYIAIFCLLFNFAFAAEYAQENMAYEQSEQFFHKVIQEEIGPQNTCLDDYLLREKKLRNWLLWTPPLAIVGVPTVSYGAAIGGIYLSSYLGASGWDVLGWGIASGVLSFGASTLAAVAIETTSAIRFYRNRQMINLIVEAHQTDDQSSYKTLNKFFRKYQKAYPSDTNVSLESFKESIKYYDENGSLCDGSLTNRSQEDKLKHRLAKKKDIFFKIHQDS